MTLDRSSCLGEDKWAPIWSPRSAYIFSTTVWSAAVLGVLQFILLVVISLMYLELDLLEHTCWYFCVDDGLFGERNNTPRLFFSHCEAALLLVAISEFSGSNVTIQGVF